MYHLMAKKMDRKFEFWEKQQLQHLFQHGAVSQLLKVLWIQQDLLDIIHLIHLKLQHSNMRFKEPNMKIRHTLKQEGTEQGWISMHKLLQQKQKSVKLLTRFVVFHHLRILLNIHWLERDGSILFNESAKSNFQINAFSLDDCRPT